MVIIFIYNNNNINGFDFEKMIGFLIKYINICIVLYMFILLIILYKNYNVDGINCLYKMLLLLFFLNNFLIIFGI